MNINYFLLTLWCKDVDISNVYFFESLPEIVNTAGFRAKRHKFETECPWNMVIITASNENSFEDIGLCCNPLENKKKIAYLNKPEILITFLVFFD